MNRAQELQLLRLGLASFNNFDGEQVARDLKENETLWDAFVFGRFEYQPLIELRDLPQGFINGDTIFVLTQKKNLEALLSLVEKWKPDELGWQTANVHGGDANVHGGDFVCKAPWEMLGADLGTEDVLIRIWWD